VVTIEDGRIVGVGREAVGVAVKDVVDLCDMVLLPGLVNAHTHLEFSDLGAPMGRAVTAL
jgi:cytosine/adenosine deaminase-related metal-dependent hydrolase